MKANLWNKLNLYDLIKLFLTIAVSFLIEDMKEKTNIQMILK